jgi:glycine/D-amino acid oxidase-like deaminating enzyme
VAVLGAGIQGSCAALALRDGGFAVDLFDKEQEAVARASRWNEGKLHLGFVFANDATAATATKMIAGSLSFFDILKYLTDRTLPAQCMSRPFNYLVSKHSLVAPGTLERAYAKTAKLFSDMQESSRGRYFGERFDWTYRAYAGAHAGLYDDAHVDTVFETVERSVNPETVALQIRDAIDECAHIYFHRGIGIDRVEAHASGNTFRVIASDGQCFGPYDFVVNALWEDRLRIDGQLGIHPARPWLHRYKLALHVKNFGDLNIPSATLVLGSFGDYVSFADGAAYLSWYPHCRTSASSALAPTVADEATSATQRAEVLTQTARRLGDYMPILRDVVIDPTDATVAGGFIFAWGHADIENLQSELHRRSDIGVRSYGRYHSIDTGKYCMAPLYALEVARRLGQDRAEALNLEELLQCTL